MTLRDMTRREIDERIEHESHLLADRLHDTIDQMRLRQGAISGFKQALEILNQSYKDMHA